MSERVHEQSRVATDRASVLLLATVETKAREVEYLATQLRKRAIAVSIVDLSLRSEGVTYSGEEKVRRIVEVANDASADVCRAVDNGASVVVAIGGGTGGEIALRVFQQLPPTFPKVLVTTLPFDPRSALADSSVILVPSIVDFCGLNATVSQVLDNTAGLAAGLSTVASTATCNSKVITSVGISALGVTEPAVSNLTAALNARGEESTVFHANGYGGAALARYAGNGALHAIVDLTPHELTRMLLAGMCIPMPQRFIAGFELPRVVLPGALNFLGLEASSDSLYSYRDRPQYKHSSFFTHVKVTADEMASIAEAVADNLNQMSGPCALIVPMGGFSNQDCPGGEIEDPELRQVFLKHAKAHLSKDLRLIDVDAHIGDSSITQHIISTLDALASNVRD